MVTSSVIVSSQLVPATQISLRNLRALCASALSFSSSYSPLSFFFSPRSFKLRKLEGSQSPSNLFRIKSFADPHPLTLMESHLYKKHRGGEGTRPRTSQPLSLVCERTGTPATHVLSSISALSHAPAESGARLLFDESQSTNPSSPALRFQHQTSRRIVSLGMVTNHSGGPAPEAAPAGFLARTIFNSGHKTIGLRYLWLALGSVLLGMLLSLLMRIHLLWPAAQIPFLSGFGRTPERYAAVTMLHGSLMVFLVLPTAPQAGFGNYFLPLEIGAREMAFPVLNLFSFWATVASLAGMTAAFFVSPDAGFTLWTTSVALFCLAGLLTALNFSVTVLDLRAKGMTLPRMPLTVWAWFINAILS